MIGALSAALHLTAGRLTALAERLDAGDFAHAEPGPLLLRTAPLLALAAGIEVEAVALGVLARPTDRGQP